MDYPKQEVKTGFSKRATVSRRDRITIAQDAAPGGSSNPQYTQLLATGVPAEVLQVAGGEYIRGKQVEANTTFVISIGNLPNILLDARCQITVLSGVYKNMVLYNHRVHFETDRARPRMIQLHCKSNDH
jgi:hypothetical protein